MGGRSLPGLAQLVTGRDNADAQPLEYFNLGHTQRYQQANLLWPQPCASHQRHRARVYIFALGPAICPRFQAGFKVQQVSVNLHILLHNDRIYALG